MPPKDSKESSSISSRLRSDNERRPSIGSLESTVSAADLRVYDRGGAMAPAPTVSTAIGSSGDMPTNFMDELHHLQASLAKLQAAASRGSSSPRNGDSHPHPSSLIPHPPPSSLFPHPPPGGVGNGPAAPSTTASGSLSGAAAATARLITGASMFHIHGDGRMRDEGRGMRDEDSDHQHPLHDDRERHYGRVPGVSSLLPSPGDLVWKGIRIAREDRWLPSSIDNVNACYQGSFRVRAQSLRPRDLRDRYELQWLSAILDSLLDDRKDFAAELCMRRIIGIESAIESNGNWDKATVLDVLKPGQLGSEEQRRQLQRDALKIQALRPKAHKKREEREGNTKKVTKGKWNNKQGGGTKSTATSD